MQFKRWFQQWGPSYWLTLGAGWLANVKIPWLKNFLIERYIRFYRVDLTTASRQEAGQFLCFQDFFTRELKAAARPIHAAANTIVSPVDGTVAACGSYSNNTIIQFKDTTTNLFNLTRSARIGTTGEYAIIYLSPKDYHRVHAPVTADLVAVTRVGGTRLSVKPRNHRQVDGLYERNVRLNCYLKTVSGEALLVMVGAMIVSSVKTVWDEENPQKLNGIEQEITPRPFAAGDEMARFCLGSTVILVIPDGVGELVDLSEGQTLHMGEPIGFLTSQV